MFRHMDRKNNYDFTLKLLVYLDQCSNIFLSLDSHANDVTYLKRSTLTVLQSVGSS